MQIPGICINTSSKGNIVRVGGHLWGEFTGHSLFLGFEFSSISSDNSLAPVRRQAVIWNNDGLVSWRIYTPLGLNEVID